MRIPDSFTLHQEARRARSKEMSRLAGVAFAMMRQWVRVRFSPGASARTRSLDLA